MDVGGAGSGAYIADAGFTGGATASNGNTVTTVGIADPAPLAVNQAVRYDATSFSKTITGLDVGETYRFRVHSAWYSTTYSFRVKANGVSMGTLSFTTPAEDNAVKVLDFTTTPDGSGDIILVFESIVSLALVCALQYWQVTGGSTVPDDVTGFDATAGLAAGVTLDWDEADDDLAVHHYRIERDTVNTFDSVDLATINTSDYAPQTYFESLAALTTYYYRIKAVDGDGNLSANWATDSVTTTDAVGKINCGGGAVGDWIADAFYTGGGTQSYGTAADTSGLTNPADADVYKSSRVQSTGNFNYSITGLSPSSTYLVRLHFRLNAAGTFAQVIQGSGVNVSQITYDVTDKARIREFYMDADADGVLDIDFLYNAGNNSFVSGIEFSLEDAPANSERINIIYLGDSIPCGHPYYDTTFPHLLSGLFPSANSYKFDSFITFDADNVRSVINLGIAGDTIAQCATRFTEDVVSNIIPGANNILILHVGSNDLAGGDTAATIAAAIFDITADAKTAGMDTCIVHTITPRDDVAGAGETKRLAINVLLNAGDASVDATVDIESLNANFSNTASDRYSAEATKVHYSEDGAADVAQMDYDALTPFVPKVVRVTWNASTDDIGVTGYKVRRATDAGFTTAVVTETVANVTEHESDVIVETPTTFYFKVAAFDAEANESEYSTPDSILVND